MKRRVAIIFLSLCACAPRTKATPGQASEFRCAPVVGDPSWIYGSGRGSGVPESAVATAKDRAIRELAVQLCASVLSSDVIEEREHNGMSDLRVEDRVQVQAVVNGIEGIEEVEREVRGSEACVLVRLGRSAVVDKTHLDRARLSRATTLLTEAAARCATDALRAYDAADASIEGLCPGLSFEGQSVAEVQAAIASARRRAEAKAVEDKKSATLSAHCGGEACPPDIEVAAWARLTAAGVTVGGDRCAGRQISLDLALEGSGERALRTATEHTASVSARWTVNDGAVRTGAAQKASGGGYSKAEAFSDAALKALERAPLP